MKSQTEPAETKLTVAVQWISLAAAVLTLLLSAAVIGGWIWEIDLLHQFKPITATALGFCSIALLFLHKCPPGKLRTAAGFLFAVLGMTAAGLDLSQFAWHWGFRWDTVISECLLHGEDFAFFGGMSPNDAVAVLMVGSALLTLSIPNRWFELVSHVLCVFALLAAMMTLLGCIFGVADFCLFISCLRISVLSGLCMTLLSLGIMLCRPKGPLTSILVSPDAGGMVARVLFPAALGIPPMLGWLRVLGEQMHIFNAETSLTVVMVGMLLIFMSLIWWMSYKLDRMDRERKQTMLQLAASEKQNRLTVQQAIDAFVAVDSSGTVRDWNFQAEKTFGWSKEVTLSNKLLDKVIPEALRERAQEVFQKFVENNQSLQRPIEFTAVDSLGREFPIELSAFPIKVDDETIYCAFVRDITERKLIEQRFQDFYSNVSHELRSPLTSISGSMKLLDTLFGQALTPKGKRLVEVAEHNCQRLIRLINDLLDIRKIEAGRLAMKMHPCEAGDLVRMALEGMEGMGVKTSVKLVPDVQYSAKLIIDQDRIIQVLTNFISNAIKYSPAGETVTIRLEQSGKGKVRFSVIDKGPGIASADQKRLFNKFEQVGSDKQQPGTGLGLVIARAIVEEHSGAVGITSETGSGSSFWFDLPEGTAGGGEDKIQEESGMHIFRTEEQSVQEPSTTDNPTTQEEKAPAQT